jgi:sulfatase maturation enzyme AslB (radical SAM superfamily)
MIINWSIGNTCNFNCTYCPDVLKSGSIPLPDPEKFAKAVKLVFDKFDSLEIQLSGGEPTVFPGLVLALEHLTPHPNKKIRIESNGSQDLSWWEKNKLFFQSVDLTYHQDWMNLDHIISVAKILQNANIPVNIKVPTTESNWEQSITALNSIKSQNISSDLQLLYKNFTKGNNKYYPYSDRQMQWYYNSRGIKPTEVTQTIEFKKQNNLNNYLGHLCWAGIDQLVIDKFGYVYRGWCEQGGYLGCIFEDDINWPEKPIVCRKSQCTNGFDLLVKKSNNSWNLT